MAKFNMRKWFQEKAKNLVTKVRVPLEGEDKPAQFTLQGMCNATIKDIIKLGKQQEGLIPGKLPPGLTPEQVGLLSRGGFNAGDFEEMLLAIAEQHKEGYEGEETPVEKGEKEKTPEKGGEKNGRFNVAELTK